VTENDELIDVDIGVLAISTEPAVLETETGALLETETGMLIATDDGGAPVNLDIRKNGILIGSATISPGVSEAAFTFPVDVSFQPKELLEISGPANAALDLADLVWNLQVT